MHKLLIGVDYSLNSPAICIFHEEKYYWISHPKKSIKPKQDVDTQLRVCALDSISLTFQNEETLSSIYSENESIKFKAHILRAKHLTDLIESCIEDNNIKFQEVHIAFEGFSYGSRGSKTNNIIDIVAGTTLLKNNLLNLFTGMCKIVSLNVYSPAAVKKLAGYGKFDKLDLFDVFCGDYSHIKVKHEKAIIKKKSTLFMDYQDFDDRGDFLEFCSSISINRAVKKPNVPKPVDDLIDAYFLANCLKRDLRLKSN